MSYIKNTLIENETIVYRANVHWVIFIWPIIWFFMGCAFGNLFFIFSAIGFINSAIIFVTSEYALTNKRIIMKEGFIKINSIEIGIDKIEGIQINQSIPGRIMGYGSILIGGTGGTKNPFTRISNPFEFRKQVQSRKDNK